MATEKTSLLHDQLNNNVVDKKKLYTECCLDIPIKFEETKNNHSDALTHEELMKYIDDPWWQQIRKLSLILFWAIVFLMLTAACVISIMERGQICPANRNNIKINNITPILTAIMPPMTKTNSIFNNNNSGSNSGSNTIVVGNSLSTETISTIVDSIEFLTTSVTIIQQEQS